MESSFILGGGGKIPKEEDSLMEFDIIGLAAAVGVVVVVALLLLL